MRMRAYAKINLGLRINRKREDGYHEIETVFHRVNIYDEVYFYPATLASMESNVPDLPADERNLCLRAANLLLHECAPPRGVHISLVKRIPIGAGLGGGSSDAATTLLGLNKFWRLNLSPKMCRNLALKLGSDVPYFLSEGSGYATGRGEILDYFRLDLPYWIVVLYPGIRISTPWAYQRAHPNPRSSLPSLKEILTSHASDPYKLQDLLRNELEPLVTSEYPQVAASKQALLDAGAVFTQMSGSGSAVYGFFTDPKIVDRTALTVSAQTRIFVTPPHFAPALDTGV